MRNLSCPSSRHHVIMLKQPRCFVATGISGCPISRVSGKAACRRTRPFVTASASKGDGPSSSGQEVQTGAGLKAVWYGAEVLGKLMGRGKETSSTTTTSTAAKMTREEIMAALREDYNTNYFVSGKGDMVAYADDCEFADPFVSFRGTGRFKQNVGNLGGLMRDIKLDVYDWQESDNQLETKWRFSCILDLPWRPLLAAAGGTTHVIDPQAGRVVRHIEAWDVEPAKVVAQLFKPAAKVPTTAAETFFLSASDGDVQGMWFAASPLVIKLSLPVVVISLICKLATGEGLPGLALGAVEGVSYLALVSACVTEVVKFAQGMQGGETGTGGRF